MSSNRPTRRHRGAQLFATIALASASLIVAASAQATTSRQVAATRSSTDVLSHVQEGGTLLLTARVTLGGAYECKWSSNVPTHGLPNFRRCRRGETLRRTVVVPVNTTTHARRVVYELSEYDMSSVFPAIVTVRRILEPAASTTPIVTTTVLSNTPVGPSGQNVVLTATITPKPSGGTVTFVASVGGAGPTAIQACTSVPVNSTTGTATCPYPLISSAGLLAVYSGSSKDIGADWAPSTSTLLTLTPTASN